MKNIVISADGPRMVYSVPDVVAENLPEYCKEFFEWLRISPDAQKYRKEYFVCYNENDFIEYLNKYKFPQQKSILVKNLGIIENDIQIPTEYKDCSVYNF